MLKKIAIIASGSGSNAQKIMEYFADHVDIEVSIVLTNNAEAFVVQRADNFEIPSIVFNKKDLYESDVIIDRLKKIGIDLVVLAGFLWLVPDNIIDAFPDRLINIHPALLPKFGGKGMYGMNVHKAVISQGETESGISIHYVNQNYDEGKVIYQSKFQIKENDTAETIAFKVQQLEHANYPKIIERVLTK
ncbi:phosphoribosylglycinamide formyltransferase [bacterium AH-315-C07]|nr:phosphoribosylglycinamide formyltransferase [bacterium AH-315-C07]